MVKFRFCNLNCDLNELLNKYTNIGWGWTEKSLSEEEQPLANYFNKCSLDYIIGPDYNVWYIKDCLDAFKQGIKIGNSYQINALRVLDFVNLLFNFYGDKYVGYDINFHKLDTT